MQLMPMTGGLDAEYGEIYAYDSNTTITIGGAGIANKVQIDAFSANGYAKGATPDHTTDDITVSTAGIYLVTVSTTIESVGAGAVEIGLGVWVNNGATLKQNLHMHREVAGGGGDTGSTSISGLVHLAAGDTVELWGYNETNANDFIVDDATLSILQVSDEGPSTVTGNPIGLLLALTYS